MLISIEELRHMLPVLLGLLMTFIMFYCLWVKPEIGRKILSQSAPWLNNSVEGWIYRIAALLSFLFMLGVTIWKIVIFLSN